jgi:SAM-dependent methyltransferase
MKITLSSKLRSTLRNNAFLYQLYGLFRRIGHEYQLYRYTAKYEPGSGLASDGNPIPPPKLRFRVHGDLSENTFIEGGQYVSADIKSILSRHSQELGVCRHYLDFGCGCARVLRHFFSAAEQAEFSGTDIDPEAIEWNQQHLGSKAQWTVNQPAPPTKYRDSQFDVIVSISVFTHLDEELQFAWLEELQRILTPDGIAVLSVHGDSIWRNYPNLVDTMEREGFHFLRNYVGFWRFDGLPDFYQVTFHSKDYIYTHWSRYFEIVGYEESAILGHQSAVILRKRKDC